MNTWCLLAAGCCLFSQPVFSQAAIVNFDKQGKQLTRFSALGDAIDAHDGEIALFGGVYYLYGTSYDCGYEWGNKSAPFCGFKVYSSTDMVNWTDRGFLFDARTALWQTRCNGGTYGCYRPHVIYNQKTGLYVLWINVYDNVSGYRVFTSGSPAGPFTESAEPRLSVNSGAPAGGLNNGDHDSFVDDDGTAYLAYTDWRANGSIVIEKLSADYLTGTGETVRAVTKSQTEAPGLFKRGGLYYVVYSDPNCGYCSGTGTSYTTAVSPLGPWSPGKKISDQSCGGQPSFVSTLKLGSDTVYLYGSDLWNHAAKNEALANYFWAPLEFAADGSILPIDCGQVFNAASARIAERGATAAGKGYAADAGQAVGAGQAGGAGYITDCGIHGDTSRSQSFKASRGGFLETLHFTSFKAGYPDAGLEIGLFKAGKEGRPTGQVLSSVVIPADSIGWSAKNLVFHPRLAVQKNKNYCVVIKSVSTKGCYGFAYTERKDPGRFSYFSGDGGKHFIRKDNQSLKLEVFIANQ